jgi:putative nucleotidyltransferase with HDIG domain
VNLLRQLEKVNKELWLLLSLFLIAALLNFVLSARMVLSFYTLPTVLSAYLYGRRHATFTALFSVVLVVWLVVVNPFVMMETPFAPFARGQWLDIAVWAVTLIATANMMGALYQHKDAQLRELRETYHGVLMILRHFISKDQYTENHSYRVSIYATKIARQLELDPERVEDVRTAALLHDLGKLEISRQILYKATRLTEAEFNEMQTHVEKGMAILEPVGGSLRRILPIILSHHDKFDGSGYHPTHGEEIPLEARIISVADVYDSLTSDRPYRKAMSPFEVRETLIKGKGTEFDPKVVEAFLAAFRKGEMEVPSLVL